MPCDRTFCFMRSTFLAPSRSRMSFILCWRRGVPSFGQFILGHTVVPHDVLTISRRSCGRNGGVGRLETIGGDHRGLCTRS